MRLFQAHELVSSANFERLAIKLVRKNCKEHKEEDIKLYCEACQVPVCYFYLCVSLGHSGHSFLFLVQQAEQKREDLRSTCASIQDSIGMLLQRAKNVQV